MSFLVVSFEKTKKNILNTLYYFYFAGEEKLLTGQRSKNLMKGFVYWFGYGLRK